MLWFHTPDQADILWLAWCGHMYCTVVNQHIQLVLDTLMHLQPVEICTKWCNLVTLLCTNCETCGHADVIVSPDCGTAYCRV